MSKVVSINQLRESSEKQDSPLQPCYGKADSRELNTLFHSLVTEENRRRFRAFPEGYCREYGLSLEQIHAVTDLDVIRLLKLGGTVINLERLTSIYGLDLKELCIEQNGKSLEEVQKQLACDQGS